MGLPMSRPTDGASLPLRYQMLAVQAYEQDLLSEGQLAERLMTDRVGVRDLIGDLTTQSQPSDDGAWHQVTLDLTAALAGE